MSENRFSFEVHDGGTGPYMLMVHGLLSSRMQWMLNLDAISRVVKPVVIELWGHGRSPTPCDAGSYGIESWVEQLERVRQELGAERVFLCGQSLGAAVTLRYALRHPERVLGQIFTNSVSALSDADRFELDEERLATIADLESEGRAALARLPVHPSRARRLAPEVQALLVRGADEVDPLAVARIMRSTASQLSLAPHLAEIGCPTLLVNGVRERSFQPFRDQAAKLMKDCRVYDIEDAGHAVNLEAPQAFNAALVSFVRSVLAETDAITGQERA